MLFVGAAKHAFIISPEQVVNKTFAQLNANARARLETNTMSNHLDHAVCFD